MDAVSGKDFRYGVFFCVKILPRKKQAPRLTAERLIFLLLRDCSVPYYISLRNIAS